METQQSRPKLAQTLSGLVAPFSCTEQWASSNTGGRAGDRGNRPVTTALATSWRNLLPQSDMANSVSCKGGEQKPERKLENNEEMDVTLLLSYSSGWNPEVCCTGVRAGLSESHWQKYKALFPRRPFPRCCWCCIFILFPFHLYTARLCSLIFVDVLQLLLFWTWSGFFSGLSAADVQYLWSCLYLSWCPSLHKDIKWGGGEVWLYGVISGF